MDHREAVLRRARGVVRASGLRRPPFSPERYAARCGVSAIVAAHVDGGPVRLEFRDTADGRAAPSGAGRAARTLVVVDRSLPPHTPQWNGAVALGLAETLLPPGTAGETRRALIEAAAAELLLPMSVFRPAALRTDLTMDGLRDLAVRFAAPIRLTARQWLSTGAWRGFALLWREEAGVLRLRWRAASSGKFPPTFALGAGADDVWGPDSRLFATYRSGRPHHGLEEVRVGAGHVWWFTRFGVVRETAVGGAGSAVSKAVFAMVMLARGAADHAAPSPGPLAGRERPEGILRGHPK